MSNHSDTPINGPASLSIWATGDDSHDWADGQFSIRIDLSPDEGVTWIEYDTFHQNIIEPLPVIFGALLRPTVVRAAAPPAANNNNKGGLWFKKKEEKEEAASLADVALHVTVTRPDAAPWKLVFERPEASSVSE